MSNNKQGNCTSEVNVICLLQMQLLPNIIYSTRYGSMLITLPIATDFLNLEKCAITKSVQLWKQSHCYL